MLGNGVNLFITTSGIITLPSKDKSFVLKNILFIPQIKKNLFLVARFTHDNNCAFEFHTTCFYVKDLKNKSTFLKGQNEGCLYV
jgi:hypothetical protein